MGVPVTGSLGRGVTCAVVKVAAGAGTAAGEVNATTGQSAQTMAVVRSERNAGLLVGAPIKRSAK